MGFFSDLLGGGKAPKAKPSAQDIANTEMATYRANLDAQYGNPLRVRQIEEARDPSLEYREEGFFASRANANTEQAIAQGDSAARQQAAVSGKGLKSSSGSLAYNQRVQAEASSAAKTQGKFASLQRADERRLNAQKVGEDMASVTQQGLSSQAASETNYQISKIRSKQEEDMAKAKMWGQIAMSAATVGAKVKDSNQSGLGQDKDIYAEGTKPYSNNQIEGATIKKQASPWGSSGGTPGLGGGSGVLPGYQWEPREVVG